MFSPHLLLDHGSNAIIRGSMLSPVKKIQGSILISAELTRHLFPFEFNFSQDLMARNVQRGRDHQVPPLNLYRQFCGLPALQTWDDAKQMFYADTNIFLLQQLFSNPGSNWFSHYQTSSNKTRPVVDFVTQICHANS